MRAWHEFEGHIVRAIEQRHKELVEGPQKLARMEEGWRAEVIPCLLSFVHRFSHAIWVQKQHLTSQFELRTEQLTTKLHRKDQMLAAYDADLLVMGQLKVALNYVHLTRRASCEIS